MAGWFERRAWRWLMYGAVILVLGMLAALGQLVAVVFLLIVGGLLLHIEQRDKQVRALAQHLACEQRLEKLEIARGSWGDLCRAINTLVQDQRLQTKVRAATPHVPEEARHTIINGIAPHSTTQRMVAVLLVSYAQKPQPDLQLPVANWQQLASATQQLAQQHGALLQPCGDAIMLVFGAFAESPIKCSLQTAFAAAQQLSATWAAPHNLPPLAISITSGIVAVTMLPGLGYCALGVPVEQALQIERIALRLPRYHVLCDESAYYALRQSNSTWQPTEFRVVSPQGRQQIVYGSIAF